MDVGTRFSNNSDFLYVCQSVSWLTSLLKLYKYRDVFYSGWYIFLKSFGEILLMLRHSWDFHTLIPKNSGKTFHPEQEISLHFSNFRKEVSQLTDWQTYKKLNSFGNGVQTSQECLKKVSERYLIQNLGYPYIDLISVKK